MNSGKVCAISNSVILVVFVHVVELPPIAAATRRIHDLSFFLFARLLPSQQGSHSNVEICIVTHAIAPERYRPPMYDYQMQPDAFVPNDRVHSCVSSTRIAKSFGL